MPDPERSRTLLEKWRMPLDQFLAYMPSLMSSAHALCRETDEAKSQGVRC